MTRKRFAVTRVEARELKRRAEKIELTGGIPHDEVVSRMHARLDRELRALVRAYRHPGANLAEIVESMAITRAEGVDVAEPCRELLEKIAATARRRAA